MQTSSIWFSAFGEFSHFDMHKQYLKFFSYLFTYFTQVELISLFYNFGTTTSCPTWNVKIPPPKSFPSFLTPWHSGMTVLLAISQRLSLFRTHSPMLCFFDTTYESEHLFVLFPLIHFMMHSSCGKLQDLISSHR